MLSLMTASGFLRHRAQLTFFVSVLAHHPTSVCDLPAGIVSDHRPLLSQVRIPVDPKHMRF